MLRPGRPSVSGTPRRGAGPLRSAPGSQGAALVPCLMLQQGEVCLPSEHGPVPAQTPEGGSYDPFDVVDRLAAEYPLIYLVDLDGVERAEPQLDFLQELSRDATLWVDGGVRTADQAIDILVTGAQRAVLSSATLRGPPELRRAWRLSTELVFEVEINADGLVAPSTWTTRDPVALAGEVRQVGVDHVVVSPREIEPDWQLVQRIASQGPTWVDGSFEASEQGNLQAAGAKGGVFHIAAFLGAVLSDREGPAPSPSPALRDDET